MVLHDTHQASHLSLFFLRFLEEILKEILEEILEEILVLHGFAWITLRVSTGQAGLAACRAAISRTRRCRKAGGGAGTGTSGWGWWRGSPRLQAVRDALC